eukprot:CAMPEP_0195103224 /NCGR_PEP_ID=MMETSP0448-20130528/71514_1 /TAXON_ID=66468 /ORGANISM="Heterocapsa triquestra, Strain CCMP 448" /LENGTH=112 /DNA_ID=CAMNT_0040138869 /DNA_START=106 /DNA_END=440 /DNA_ORIENTATION=+
MLGSRPVPAFGFSPETYGVTAVGGRPPVPSKHLSATGREPARLPAQAIAQAMPPPSARRQSSAPFPKTGAAGSESEPPSTSSRPNRPSYPPSWMTADHAAALAGLTPCSDRA